MYFLILTSFFQCSSSAKNIFNNLPALSAPLKSDPHDELNRYLSMDPEHVTDAITWWYKKCSIYPRLHHMALDYLYIPGRLFITLLLLFQLIITVLATSVDVEHVFSQGRLLLSHIQSHLSVQLTHAFLCLGVWSKLSYITNSDVKAVVLTLPKINEEDDKKELDINWDRIN